MPLSVQTNQNVALQYEIASVGDRILANIIDWTIYFSWILAMVATINILPNYTTNTFFQVGFITLPIVLYPLLTEYYLNGQTVGKKAIKIKVVALDGGKPTLGAYLMRWLLAIIDCFPFSPVVAIVTIAINGKGQRLGDIAAATTVVKIGSKVSLSDIALDEIPDNYRVSYPEAIALNDQDINTLRRVLQKNNEEIVQLTADRVGAVLNNPAYGDARLFLQTVLNDNAYLALKN